MLSDTVDLQVWDHILAKMISPETKALAYFGEVDVQGHMFLRRDHVMFIVSQHVTLVVGMN